MAAAGILDLTHIAFADDQTLLASNWLTMKQMISSLRAALLKKGPTLQPSKCKVQTNQRIWHVEARWRSKMGSL